MLRLLKWLVYLVVIAAVVLVAGSFLLPATVTVTRSIEIAAPPEKVFALVGDLERLNEFSPWAEIDPNTKYTFEGPDSGVGQKMSWSSADENVGTGSQTISAYQAPSHVGTDLDFGEMGKATATWDLEPAGAGTKATWGFRSEV